MTASLNCSHHVKRLLQRGDRERVERGNREKMKRKAEVGMWGQKWLRFIMGVQVVRQVPRDTAH